jgi:methylglyoxal/glyoxal reductase
LASTWVSSELFLLFLQLSFLSTGAYSNNNLGYGAYPECWSVQAGCGQYATQAVQTWIQAGGRRIDNANSYQDQSAVGLGIRNSGVAREELFILSKIGPSLPMGYADAMEQFQIILANLSTTYVDMLLIHWPWQNPSQGNVTNNSTQPSQEPSCNPGTSSYNMTTCRLDTWRALVDIFNAGGARAIGVSNYNSTYFDEIIAAGMPLPSLVQNPFHLYHSVAEQATIDYCRQHNILFLGYSPLGVPDWHKFPTNGTKGLPAVTELTDPVVLNIAAAHGVTPAQVLLAWQYQSGIPFNPRTLNRAHMLENLNVFDINLTPAELNSLWTRPQSTCDIDNWYECMPVTN